MNKLEYEFNEKLNKERAQLMIRQRDIDIRDMRRQNLQNQLNMLKRILDSGDIANCISDEIDRINTEVKSLY